MCSTMNLIDTCQEMVGNLEVVLLEHKHVSIPLHAFVRKPKVGSIPTGRIHVRDERASPRSLRVPEQIAFHVVTPHEEERYSGQLPQLVFVYDGIFIPEA